MRFTQDQLKELSQEEPFTENTELFEGMHIYTIVNNDQKDSAMRKGYILLAHEMVFIPTSRDWEAWEATPDSGNRSRFSVENPDDYWLVVDADDFSSRSLMTVNQIKKMELLDHHNGNFFVVYD